MGRKSDKEKKDKRFRMHIDMPRGLSPFPSQFLPFRVASAESAATAMSQEDGRDGAAAGSGATKDAPGSSLSAACAAALARRLAPSAPFKRRGRSAACEAWV